MGYEYRTSVIVEMLATGTLTTCLLSLWRSAGMVIYALKVASLLTSAPTNRLNATVFGFAPDVIFSVDSAAKKAVAISGVSAGIGLVLNFWYQFLYNGSTAAKFQVCFHSRITIALFYTDYYVRSKPAIPSTLTFSSACAADSRYSSC